MVNLHVSVANVSRSGGKSVVAKSRYQHATRGLDEVRGRTFDYSGKRSELVYSEIDFPDDAPFWLSEGILSGAKGRLDDVAGASLRLWNSLDMAEEASPHWRSKDAVVAKALILSLPNELSNEENIRLMREFTAREFSSRGLVADWVIHDPKREPGQDSNPHVHILVSTRVIGPEGWGLKHRDLNAPNAIRSLRFSWASCVNLAYERAGLDIRVDHRTLEDQGIDLLPTGHNPHIAEAMEARGVVPYEKLLDIEARAENERRLLERPERIIALVSQKSRVFTAGYLRDEFMKRVTCSPEELEAALATVMASPELVVAGEYGPTGEALYTSQTRVTQERALVNQALSLADDKLDIDGHNRIHQLSKGLGKTQRVAAEAMLSPDRITLVTGYAGTGKTFTIAEVSKIWRDRGYAVYGGAASGKATQELNGIVGLEAGTLAAWESRWARGLKMPQGKFVFLMDEAGMVGGDVWSRIQDQVAKQGGKFIAVGDAEQLPPVGDSGPFLRLQEKIGAAVMDEVRRHKNLADREATTMFARGGKLAADAIRYYHKTGRVHFVGGVDDAMQAITEKYFAEGVQPHNLIASALSNADVFALNDSIRAHGKAIGKIGEVEVNLGRVARIERTAAGGEKRSYIDLMVAEGDRLIFTKAHRELRVPKSSLATVLSVSEGELVLRVESDKDDAPRTLRIDTTSFKHFDYGFAVTIYKTQGMTVDQNLVLGHGYMNQHTLYVAGSRHRDHVEFFMPQNRVENIERLAELARTKGYIVIDELDAKPSVAMTPHVTADPMIGGRVDQRRIPELSRVHFEGDPHIMGVSNRTAGLLAADYIEGDPMFVQDVDLRYYETPHAVVDDLARMNSVFTATQVADKLSEIILDPDTFVTTFEKAMSHPALVIVDHEVSETGTRLYSTKAQVALEMEVVDRGVRLAMAEHLKRIDGARHKFDGVLNIPRLRAGYGLSDPQISTMQRVLNRDGLSIISGPSGSGKSRVAAALGAEINARRHGDLEESAVVLAPTGAGIEALRRAGAEAPMTLHQYARSVNSGTLKVGKNTTLIIDDAGMVSAADAQNILAHVEARGMRVIALRDTDQFGAYGAGPVFEMLEARVGSFSLAETWRQHNPQMKAALDAIGKRGSDATPMEGGAQLVEAGIIKAGETLHRSLDILVEDFLNDPALSKVALAPSKVQVGTLNDRIRKALDDRMPARLETAVEDADDGSLDALRQGDKIKLVTAYRAANLRPGTSLEVLSRNADSVLLKVETSDASELTLRLRGNPEDFQYRFAFAETVHAVKGQDIDSVHMLATTGMNRAGLYTGMALHRHALNVVVPVSEAFLDRTVDAMVSTEGLRQGALDYSLDVAMAAREATRNRFKVPDASRIKAGFDALKGVIGVGSSDPADQTPPSGVIAEGISEVINGHILESGVAPSQELQADYVAVLEKVTNQRAWTTAQRNVGQEMSKIAYDMALDRAGAGSDGSTALPVAVALSRSATLATALGQTDLADRFQRALDIYGARAHEARRTIGIEAFEVVSPKAGKPIDPLAPTMPTASDRVATQPYYMRGSGMPSLRSLHPGSEITIIRNLLKEIAPTTLSADFAAGVIKGWIEASPRGHNAGGWRIDEPLPTAPVIEAAAPQVQTLEGKNMLALSEDMEDALVSAFTSYAKLDNAAHDMDDMRVGFRKLHEKALSVTDDQAVEGLAEGFARDRAVNDLRVRLAYEVKPNGPFDWNECLSAKTSPFLINDYDAHVEFGKRLNSQKQNVVWAISSSDRELAKMVLAADRSNPTEKALADGIEHIAEYTQIKSTDGASIRAGRNAMISDINEHSDVQRLFGGNTSEAIAGLYRSFTLKEITALARPAEQLPSSLADLSPEVNRSALATSVLDLLKARSGARTAPRHSFMVGEKILHGPRLGLDRDLGHDIEDYFGGR